MMPSKRKSVTFRENVLMIYPKHFDGSSSPGPVTNTPVTATPSLTLDPMYLAWLRAATKAHFPFIVNGTFAQHVYRQNFDEHIKIRNNEQLERAKMREAAVPFLAEKYGSLGWGTLYRVVSKEAWVKNYREIYRFDGSDELLLEKIAEAYDEIKRTIAEEEEVHAQFTHDRSFYGAQSTQQWESYTQGGGALISPDLGPGGVGLTFDGATDAPFDEEGPARYVPPDQGWKGQGMRFDVGVAGRDFGSAMVRAGV